MMIFITLFVKLLLATPFESMDFRDLKLTLQQLDAFDDQFKQAVNSDDLVDVILELTFDVSRIDSTVPERATAKMMCKKTGSDVCVALNANCDKEAINFAYIGKEFPSPSDTYYCAQFMYDVKPSDRDTIEGLVNLASDGTMGALSCNGEVHALQYPMPENQECQVERNARSWGLRFMDVQDDRTHTYFENDGSPKNGRRTVAYVLDTGVAAHNDYGSRLKGGKDFTNSRKNPEWDDGNGHGTHVAGTIGGTKYGVAKAVDIYAGKVLKDSGGGTFTGVINGIVWAWERAKANNENAVINMSLGGGRSSAVNNAVNTAVREGVSVVVAAGNDAGDACNKSPASAELAITVGSFQSDLRRSGFSNYGSCVNVFAPGTSITSAWIGSLTNSRTISGTSMASPHVAGVVAAILSRSASNLTPSEISALIETGAYGKSNQIRGTLPSRTPNRIVQVPCLSSDVPSPTKNPTLHPTLNPTEGETDEPTLNPTSNPTFFDDTTLPRCVIVEKSPKFWKFANGVYTLLGPDTTTPEGQRVYKNNDTGEKTRYLYWTVKNGKGYWFIDDDFNSDTLLAFFNSHNAQELPVSSGKYWAKKEWREFQQSSIKAIPCSCRTISKQWTHEQCQERCHGNGNSCHKQCRNRCGESCSCNEELFQMEGTPANQQSCVMQSSESICPEFADCQCS